MNRLKNKKGMSIVENLMAVVVLSSLLMIIVTLFPAAYKTSEQGERIVVATQEVKQIIEEAKASGFFALESKELSNVTLNKITFHKRIEVTPLGSYDPELIKRVKAVVWWGERKEDSVEFETLFYNRY